MDNSPNILEKRQQDERVFNEIQKSLDFASHGAIYVKIGNIVSRKIQIELLETFRDMNQIFLFEHEAIEYHNLPRNIIISENMPSKIILSHKNTTLFITRDDNLSIRRALHCGIPMLIIPFQNNEIHSIVKTSALENMYIMSFDGINKELMSQTLKRILSNRNMKKCAKEIADLLHHEHNISANQNIQTTRQLTTTNLHLDALGALFFIIFVIVKLSLKFCRFYNNLEWKLSSTSKRT